LYINKIKIINQLFIKSEKNIEAAYLLINNDFYASSVHYSYYSCFQLIKHIVLNNMKINLDMKNEKSSHDIVYKHIQPKIIKDLIYKQLNEKYTLLKKMRKEADYEEIEIDANDAILAFDCAEFINEYLLNKIEKNDFN